MTILRRIELAERVAALLVALVACLPFAVDGNWVCTLWSFASLPFICVLSGAAARWALSPFQAMVDRMSQLQHGEIDRLEAHTGPPEVRQLADWLIAIAESRIIRDGNNTIAVADLAHQLRTQLQLLGMRIDDLADQLPAGSETHARARADVARMHDILTEQLDGACGTPDAPVEVAVATVVPDRLTAWSGVAARNHAITIRTGTIDSATILARRGSVEHLLDILLDNAIKHSPAHGEILVTAQVNQSGHELAIQVVDHGPGMTAAQRDQAINRGWQAGPADGRGRGLGLSIADVLMKSNRGRLTLDSTPSGRGLSVGIHFPVVRIHRPGTTPAETPPRLGPHAAAAACHSTSCA
jgi:signal transduction histidine kinase